MSKLFIYNARVATSSEVFEGSVLVIGEHIAGVFRGEERPQRGLDGCELIDAKGGYLLPGGVDPHTHFDIDVGGARASDDFHTGSIAAACGGTTTVVDHMGFGPAGCALTHQPKVYQRLAKPSVIDYALHGVVQHVDSGVLRDMEALREDYGITSLKIYLTYDYKLGDSDILKVLRRAKELGMVVCAHCENDAIVAERRAEFVRAGRTSARFHPLSRPAEAEAEAVFRVAMLAKAAGGPPLYIVHLSGAQALAALRPARGRGCGGIFAETCPQYLLLNDRLYADDAEGLKYIMSPPLRGKADNRALWRGLAREDITAVGTDHCPFLFATQKQAGRHDFTRCPGGAPGVELRMALMFSEGFMKGRLTLPQMVRACCTNPARIFGLSPKKGDIAAGAHADLVLFDPAAKWTVSRSELHERVDYTPYEGMRVTGRPVLTVARGEVICENGRFSGREGRGRYVERGLYSPASDTAF